MTYLSACGAIERRCALPEAAALDGARVHTCFGTLPVRVKTNRIILCPASAVGSNINGQPPSMTVIPWVRPYSVAASETLPAPNEWLVSSLAGWDIHLDHLAAALDGRPVDWPNWWADYFGAWSEKRDRYAAKVG